MGLTFGSALLGDKLTSDFTLVDGELTFGFVFGQMSQKNESTGSLIWLYGIRLVAVLSQCATKKRKSVF